MGSHEERTKLGSKAVYKIKNAKHLAITQIIYTFVAIYKTIKTCQH